MKPDALPRSAYAFTLRHTTRWADNDVYGHVNNALYYSFFDTTITAYLIGSCGLAHAGDGPMVFVAASGCAYFKPFAFPEAIDGCLAVERIGRSSVTWRIGLFGEGEDDPRAQGHFTHVCIDRGTRAPCPWPENWVAAFEELT